MKITIIASLLALLGACSNGSGWVCIDGMAYERSHGILILAKSGFESTVVGCSTEDGKHRNPFEVYPQ